MKVVLFFLTVAGSGWAIWWKIDARVSELREDLAEHKLHTAEKYITKEGLRETTEQIMGAIGGVKTAIDNMTLRVDRVVENQNKPPRSSRAS